MPAGPQDDDSDQDRKGARSNGGPHATANNGGDEDFHLAHAVTM